MTGAASSAGRPATMAAVPAATDPRPVAAAALARRVQAGQALATGHRGRVDVVLAAAAEPAA